nr:reverse transcriptase domain-containing protein [Tanacetum cinerariifolium]
PKFLPISWTFGDDANKHLGKFLHVTQSIKVNRVTDDALRLYLFPHSLTHHATIWFDRLSRNSITTFEQMAKIFLGKYFPPSMLMKSRNEIPNFHQRPDELLFVAWERYKISINRCPNHNMLPDTKIDTFYNGLTLRHRDTINAAAGGTFMKRCLEECYDLIENMIAHHNDWDNFAQRNNYLGPPGFNQNQNRRNPNQNYQNRNQGNNHGNAPPPAYQAPSYQASGYQVPIQQDPIPQPQVVTTTQFTNYMKANDAILKNMQTNMTSLTNSNLELKNMFGQFMKMNTASSSGSRTLPMERETEVTKDTVPPIINKSTKDVQPLVVQFETQNSEPIVAPVVEPVEAPVSAPKPNLKLAIPYPSRLNGQKLREKANDKMEKFFRIFQDLNFNISFANALILMPKFSSTIKSLLTNKEKLFELARTPLNEHCLAVLLKKLQEKLGDPGKFLIPYDFPGMDECLALANLGASINLMPLSIWNKISLPELSPTCMTLELADRLISRLVGVTEDVSVKVGRFHFSADFVIVDFDADPRVPQTLRRSFLKTGRALIDVNERELTLRDDKLPFINAKDLKDEEKTALIKVLKLLDAGLIYPISDSPWVSPVHCIPKKGGFTVIESEENGLIPTRLVTEWRVYIDYLKLNNATLKDHFPLPFMDQMLERLAGNEYFLNGFSGYLQIPIDPQDQEKTTLTCPYGTFAYRRIPFGLCNASGMFQRCMMAIFHDMLEKTMEVFMENFLVFGNSFETYISHMDKMLKRCEDTNLCLNWEKSHFIVKEGIILGHKISKNRIEVDKARVDVIAKLLHPSTVKGIQSFLSHVRLKIFSGKLKTHWTGPFTITQVFPYGTVELSQIDEPNIKVNGQRLKHYFGEDIPLMIIQDLQTFPKDQ